MNNILKSRLWLALPAIVLSGCTGNEQQSQPSETTVRTERAEVSPSQSAPANRVDLSDQPRARGTASAVGQVLYNGKGAANIEVKLCEDFSTRDGCRGATFGAVTDANGDYLVKNVPPGDYGMMVAIFETGQYLFPKSGAFRTAKFTLKAGETLPIREVNLWKLDLRPLAPANNSEVDSDKPTLSWQAYPDAAQYKISLRARSGTMKSQFFKTDKTSITPPQPLHNGLHTWTLTAYNGDGVQLAVTPRVAQFTVTGQKQYNDKIVALGKVDLVSPAKNATVSGTDLTLRWKPVPNADEYRVFLKSSQPRVVILNRVSVKGTAKRVEQTLPAKRYNWQVRAYKNGRQLSYSPVQFFTVK